MVEAEKIITESKDTQEALEKLRALKPRRQPAPPPPEGGISLRAASRKYGVHHTTILKWVKKGILPVIKRTDNWLYVDEQTIQNIMKNGARESVTN